MGPVTKDELIAGILKMAYTASISEAVALQQIKLFATDHRLPWKE